MKVVALLSQKGGSGKTTLAIHSAVAAHEAGARVVLIDTDPQRSATTWAEARQAEEPTVATVSAGDLPRVLAAARKDARQIAIIDSPPHAAPSASLIARAADLVAIPVRPTALDLAAAEAGARIVKAARVPGVFVLSACPFRAPEIAETRAALAAYGLPVAEPVVTDRRAFARAIASGRAATEFETRGAAAEEIRALWAWLMKAMESRDGRKDK